MKNIWVPISGQIAQQNKIDTIANNIANANTDGFKADQVAFKEHLTKLSSKMDTSHIDIPPREWEPKDFYHTDGNENSFVKTDATYTNFAQGSLKKTQSPLDIALNGEGFFTLMSNKGPVYSRSGSFVINSKGLLSDKNGNPLLITQEIDGKTVDSPLSIDSLQTLNITEDHQVYTNGLLRGKIKITEFKDKHALRKIGQNLFLNSFENNIQEGVSKTQTLQGFLEGSNVNALKEMSDLIKAHRQFESIQKAINAYDSISSKAINELPRF